MLLRIVTPALPLRFATGTTLALPVRASVVAGGAKESAVSNTFSWDSISEEETIYEPQVK